MIKKYFGLIIAIFILFSNCLIVYSQDYQTLNKRFKNYIRQAISFESQGKIAAANESYRKAEKVFPYRFEALFGLAKTYGWLNSDNQATKYYKELLEKNPDNIAVLEAYAGFLKDNKNFDQALKIYCKLSELTKIENYYQNFAEIYFLQGNYPCSLEYYLKAYKNKPDDLQIQKNLALLYFISGDFNKANEFYQIYLAKVNDPEAFLNYGKSLFYSGNIQKSRQVLEQYIQTYPDNLEALKTLGEIYTSLNMFSQAINVLSRANQLNPTDLRLKIQLGRAYIALNNFGEAKTIFSQILVQEPRNPEILENLGDIFLYTSNFQSSLNYFLSASNIHPSNNLTFKVAEASRLSGKIKEAEEFYTKLLCYPEFKAKALLGLAQISLIKSKPKEARKLFQEVLSLEPKNTEASIGIASTYSYEGYNLTAIDILKKLPLTDNVRYQLALAYNEIERYDLSLEILDSLQTKRAKEIREDIKTTTRTSLEPVFSIYDEAGDVNKIRFQRYGGQLFYYPKPNYILNGSIVATPYSSGGDVAEVTSTFYSAGLAGKPTNKIGFNSNIGIDSFSNNEETVLGNIAFDVTPNDILSINFGYIREKIEDSILSVSGLRPLVGPFANELVGKAADNKFISNLSFKLPYSSYAYAGYNLGYVRGKNILTNPYQEATGGIGKIVLSRPEESFLNQIETGYNIYFASYKYDLSGFGGADLAFSPLGSDGISPEPIPGNSGIGGYFSPNFILTNRFLLNLRGNLSLIRLKYLIGGYIGTSNLRQGNVSYGTDLRLYYGGNVVLGINEDGRVGLRAVYRFDNFEVTTEQEFIVNLIFRF